MAHNPVTNQFMVTQRDDTAVATARLFTAGLKRAGVVAIDDFPANGAGGKGGITGSPVAADPITGNWLVASSTDFQSEVTTNLISSTGALLRPAVTSKAGGIPIDLVALGDGQWVAATTGGRVVQLSAGGSVLADPKPFSGNLMYAGVATNSGAAQPRVVAFGPTANLATVVVLDVVDAALIPVVPGRLLETRAGLTTVDGRFQGVGRVGGGTVFELPVTGRSGVPGDADAVMLNVTAVGPVAAGFLTVFPCGSSRPIASSVNYAAGDVVPNAVLAKVGAGGKVCIYTLQSTDVIVDVNGFVPAGGALSTVVPGRLLETRAGLTTVDGRFQGVGRVGGGTVFELPVTGRSGVPGDADAVMLNVTAVGPVAAGFLTVFPCGSSRPIASSVNYAAGDVVPNAVLAKVGAGGKVCIYTLQSTDVIVDVNGFVPAGGALSTVVPGRLLETRAGLTTVDGRFQGVGRVGGGTVFELPVTGRSGVPGDADAVMLNVTAVGPVAAGFLTVFPCGSSRPIASSVNYAAGDVVPNAVLAKVGAGGKVCIYTLQSTDVIVDVTGYTPAA